MIAGFQVRHPGVRFQVRSAAPQPVGATLDDDATWCSPTTLRAGPGGDGRHRAAALRSAPTRIIRSPAARSSASTTVSATRWRSATELRQPAADRPALLDRSAGKAEIVFVSNSVESLKAATRRTGAISFQFEAGTRRDAFRGELVARPLSDRSLASGRLVLAARSSRVLPIASAAFAESLAAALNAY